MSWKKWAKRLNTYLTALQGYLWPDLIILGGGISKTHEKFLPLLTLDTMIVPAHLRNEAGIIGAALAASKTRSPRSEPALLLAEHTNPVAISSAAVC